MAEVQDFTRFLSTSGVRGAGVKEPVIYEEDEEAQGYGALARSARASTLTYNSVLCNTPGASDSGRTACARPASARNASSYPHNTYLHGSRVAWEGGAPTTMINMMARQAHVRMSRHAPGRCCC